jgi:hypothetical protein
MYASLIANEQIAAMAAKIMMAVILSQNERGTGK